MLKNISRQFSQSAYHLKKAAVPKKGPKPKSGAVKARPGYKKADGSATTTTKSQKTGSMNLGFRDAVRNTGYERNAPPLDFLGDLSYVNNINQLQGEILKYETDTESSLKELGSFKRYQHHELFSNPVSLVSDNLIQLQEQVFTKFEDFNQNKWCLQGAHRSGKSTLLSQIQALSLSKYKGDVLLLHMDHCEKIRNGTTDYIYNKKSDIYQQPFLTKTWMLQVAKANEKVLKKIVLTNDVTFITDKVTFNYKKGENNLYEFLTNCYAVNKFEISSNFEYFINELKASGIPVLVTIDNFTALTLEPQTKYKTPEFAPIHITQLELGKFIFDLISGQTGFAKGGLLVSESSDIGRSENLLVGLNQLEFDPYKSKILDPSIIESLLAGKLQSFEVNNLTKPQVANLIKFYHQVGVLHIRDYAYTQKNENQVSLGVDLDQLIESNYVKSSGNPGLLIRHVAINY